jgi:hypothetical protein
VAEEIASGKEPRVEYLREAVGGENVSVAADDDGGLFCPAVKQEAE